MKRQAFVVTCTLLAAMAAGAETITAPMDFSQARALAHERADTLRMDAAETARRQYQAQSDRSLHHPKVSIDVKQVWGSKTVDMGEVTLGQFLPPSLMQGMQNSMQGVGQKVQAGQLPPEVGGMANQMAGGVQKLVNTPIPLEITDNLAGPRAVLAAEMPIYTGGAISAKVRASEESVMQSQAQMQVRRDQIDTELAQKYFAVQLARSVVRLHEEMLEQQEVQLKKAVRYQALGSISKLERMAVEVNRDAAKRDLLASRTNCRVAETELAGLLRVAEIGPLASDLFVVTDNIGPLHEWQKKAQLTSPVLQGVQAQTRQADAAVSAARAAWSPQVYAFAQANLIRHYLSITEPDWIAGIGVKFTLWDNKDRNASIAAARSLVHKAQAAYSEAANRINTAVETAYLRSDQARQEYRLTASTLALAEENLRLRERSFAEGLSTADEVNEARSKLLAAEVARRVAAYRFVAAWAALNGIAGSMNDFVDSMSNPTNIIEK